MMTQSDESQPVTPVSHAVISPEQVRALVSDLSALAQIEHIFVRPAGGAGRGAADRTTRAVELKEVPELLEQSDVAGVQIRYQYDGASWIDTLSPGEEGIRLVRIRHSPE